MPAESSWRSKDVPYKQANIPLDLKETQSKLNYDPFATKNISYAILNTQS